MAAYMIAEVCKIWDLAKFREYNSIVPKTVEKYGGRFLVRGGETETVEGEWQPQRLVVVEFDDAHALRRWYESSEYQQVRPLRVQSAQANVVFSAGALDAAGTGGEA